MKKLLYLSFLLPAICACQQESPPLPQEADSAPPINVRGHFNRTQAIDFALDAVAEFTESSRATLTVTPANCSAITNPASRGSNDTLIHVVNFDDNNGFALVSAEDCDNRLFAYIPEGRFDMEEAQGVPGFNMLLANMVSYASDLAARPNGGIVIPTPNPDIRREYWLYDTLFYKEGGVGKVCNWGQNDVEGMYFSNYTAGCGPVAIGMAMTHFKPSQRIYYNFPGATVASEIPNWDEICRHSYDEIGSVNVFPYPYVDAGNCSHETHKTIGRICRQIAHYAGSKETPKGTSTTTENARNVLIHYLPNCQVSQYYTFSPSGVASASSEKNLIFIVGHATALKEMEGMDPDSVYKYDAHMWLITDSKASRVHVKQYSLPQFYAVDLDGKPVINGEAILLDEGIEEKSTFYHNFGWYNRYNGWISGTFLPSYHDSYVHLYEMHYLSIKLK